MQSERYAVSIKNTHLNGECLSLPMGYRHISSSYLWWRATISSYKCQRWYLWFYFILSYGSIGATTRELRKGVTVVLIRPLFRVKEWKEILRKMRQPICYHHQH